MEIEIIKKSETEQTLEVINIRKRSEIRIINRIRKIEKRLSGRENNIEDTDTTVKENTKCKKLLTQNTQENQDTMKRPNLIRIEENEDSQLKGPENVFNKIMEENFPNLNKEMAIKVQEAYKTPNKQNQKRKSSCHIIIKTLNAQNKERILKDAREKAK